MNQKKLVEVLTKGYEAHHMGISLPAPYVVPLLAEPTQEQLEQLKAGDGNPVAEMCRINSSAGLAFNYYKLYEGEVQKVHKSFEVRFEEKVGKPLSLSGGKCAHLDVSYSLDGTQYYIESKFLEPYYSKRKHNTCSYRNKDKQDNEVDNYKFSEEETKVWLELLENETKFQYYDFPQLYRHLLAIRRKHEKQGKVVLQSVSWKMTESFKAEYLLTKDDESRLKTLDEERRNACGLFNNFLNQIGWADCSFETKYYNDMLDDIRGAEKFNDFCKQYFLDYATAAAE
ncbi:MAG: hypothetical protein IJU72_05050 [Bacteroidales bacterium]|nr:hypothetical protein [Bacteroidales bacterium]